MTELPVYPRVLPVGDAAFTVEFGNDIDHHINRRVHAFDAALQRSPFPALVETVPSYCALLVIFDPATQSASTVENLLRAAIRAMPREIEPSALPGKLVELPVRYGGRWGPDLADVAAHCGLPESEVIRRHSQAEYMVAMLGFAPGFAYLLGMPPELTTPRLATPRLSVPAGSVGIADAQTGVYALKTPGGWRIIGQTPVPLFNPVRSEPFVLAAGDRVRFVAE